MNNFFQNVYYLMIREGFCNKELDQVVKNLILIVLKSKNYDHSFRIEKIMTDFKKIIGFEISFFAMHKYLCELQNKGYISYNNVECTYCMDYTKIKDILRTDDIDNREKELNKLNRAFFDFICEKDASVDYDLSYAEGLINSFVEHYGALFTVDKKLEIPRGHDDYLFATFISQNEEYFHLVEQLIAGRIFSELLFHEDDNEINKNSFKNTTVYLDTGIIFMLLGIDELDRAEYYKKLILDMQSVGIKIKIFSHNLKEIHNILSNSVMWIDNPDFDSALATKSACYFVTNKVNKLTVEEIIATLVNKLESLGIDVDDSSYPLEIPKDKKQLMDFYDEIVKFYKEHNPAFDEDEKKNTIYIDAQSFFYIYYLNNFANSFTLDSMKNIFVTDNKALSIVSKQLSDSPQSIPFCVTDIFWGALLWKLNPNFSNVTSKHVVSNFIFKALNPSEIASEKFSKMIQESLENQKITPEECVLLKQHKLARNYLVEVTEGDIDRITIETPREVIERIEANSKEQGRSEEIQRFTPILEDKNKEIENIKQELLNERLAGLTSSRRQCEKNISDLNQQKTTKENRREKIQNNTAKVIISLLILCAIIGSVSIIIGVFWDKINDFLYVTAITTVITYAIPLISLAIYIYKKFFLHTDNIIDALIPKIAKSLYEKNHCSDIELEKVSNEIITQKEEIERINLKLEEILENS